MGEISLKAAGLTLTLRGRREKWLWAQTKSWLCRTVLGNDLTCMFPVCIVGKTGIPLSCVVRWGLIDKLRSHHRKLASDRTLPGSAECTKLLFCCCVCYPGVLIALFPCSGASLVSHCRVAKLSCDLTVETNKISACTVISMPAGMPWVLRKLKSDRYREEFPCELKWTVKNK